VILAVLALFLSMMLYEGSKAAASGTVKGIRFNVKGVGAMWVVFFLLTLTFFPKPDTRVVRISMLHQGRPVDASFSVTARVRDMEPIKRQSDSGEVSIQLPSTIVQFDDLSVKCAEYRLRDKPPYRINQDNRVLLAAIKNAAPDPQEPGALPSETIIPDLPTRQQVGRPPKVEPKKVSLLYKNVSDEDALLLVFSASKYYTIIDEHIGGGSAWQTWPIPSQDEFIPYDKFVSGTGWYSFVVRDSSGHDTYVGTWNVFESPINRLTIEHSDKKRFMAKLEGSDE
jgi:hypothetical protein